MDGWIDLVMIGWMDEEVNIWSILLKEMSLSSQFLENHKQLFSQHRAASCHSNKDDILTLNILSHFLQSAGLLMSRV